MVPDEPQTRSGDFPSDASVPKVVVSRISLYLRELQRLEAAGQKTISSGQLGTLLGFSDAQVRKDLGFFGQFGYPGVGYRCEELIHAMRDILGTNQPWPVVMIGVGNLGQALLGYRGFGQQNFSIAAAFDADPQKIGKQIQGLRVQPLTELAATIRDKNIRLGMIVVPAGRARRQPMRWWLPGLKVSSTLLRSPSACLPASSKSRSIWRLSLSSCLLLLSAICNDRQLGGTPIIRPLTRHPPRSQVTADRAMDQPDDTSDKPLSFSGLSAFLDDTGESAGSFLAAVIRRV